MIENFAITVLSVTQFSLAITQNLSGVAGFFQRYFAGTDNLRIVSIILLLLAFVLFLFLVVILYIKSLLSFIKDEQQSVASSASSYTPASAPSVSRDLELEKELEKELERDLENTRYKRQQAQNLQIKEKAKEKEERVNKPSVFGENFRGNASQTEFDWKTGKTGELDELAAGVLLNSHINSRPLIDLTGLIITMLGRNIDAGKIAQTVRSKCGNCATEEEVIQTIDSIKSFISLSNNRKFNQLAPDLPSPHEALTSLAKGDAGPALSMLEALINALVDKASQAKTLQKRDIIFLEASNYACIFGSIANLDGDNALATSSYELAIELSPKNANAWSRAADAYATDHADSKAVWAYQNVLKYADADLYPHQVANAHKKLAAYYEAQGDKLKASKLMNLSSDYYQTIGINLGLTSKEQDIIDIIESKQEADLPETVEKLLNLSGIQQRRNYI